VSFEPIRLEVCFHCGNRVPLSRLTVHPGREMFDHNGGERQDEDFEYHVYQCPTCRGVSIYGDFTDPSKTREEAYHRIYPQGNRLLPEGHLVTSLDCVPANIVKLYDKAWPLRHIDPGAFAVKIRGALELICNAQGLQGDDLAAHLKVLVAQNTLPGYFGEMTFLMRKVGNIAAHPQPQEVDYWQAEQLDEFFRLIIEYLYVLPSRMRRLKGRLREVKAASHLPKSI
jgi:hypothetical protein